jgi:hypothetical protein
MTRTAHWGTCQDCEACVVVYPHPERAEDIPDQGDWDGPMQCYVCDGFMDWGGADPAHEIIRGFDA